MAQPSLRRYTEAEYLAREDKAKHRSEFYRGEIFAISSGSINHDRIIGNTCLALRIALNGRPCETFTSNMRVLVEKYRLYAYPDVSVVGGGVVLAQNRNDTITNPILIIEVLSESTERYDRTDKFRFHRAIPSLWEYVLIDQYAVRVEHYWKGEGDLWMFEEITATDGEVTLHAVEASLSVRELYARVEFDGHNQSLAGEF